MITMGVSEARSHLGALLDRVERGEAVIITRRGVPVLLIPADDGWAGAANLDRLPQGAIESRGYKRRTKTGNHRSVASHISRKTSEIWPTHRPWLGQELDAWSAGIRFGSLPD